MQSFWSLVSRDGPTGGKRTIISSLENLALGTTEPTGAALLQRRDGGGKMRAITLVIYEKPAAKRIEKAAVRHIKENSR